MGGQGQETGKRKEEEMQSIPGGAGLLGNIFQEYFVNYDL